MDPSLSISDFETMDPVEAAKNWKQAVGFDLDGPYSLYGGICPVTCTPAETLMGKFGLHCYNSHKGTNLQFNTVTKVNLVLVSLITYYITLEAMDPDNNTSSVAIQTSVWHASPKNKEDLRLITTSCWIKGSEEVGSLWDPNGVDDFYTGAMPKWLDGDELTGKDKPLYYELKESELQQNKWLYLYAEVAVYSNRDVRRVDHFPLEIEKVVVQTMEEDVVPSMKLKSSNAIFYLSFKTRGGDD